jgi:hypothetical protein
LSVRTFLIPNQRLPPLGRKWMRTARLRASTLPRSLIRLPWSERAGVTRTVLAVAFRGTDLTEVDSAPATGAVRAEALKMSMNMAKLDTMVRRGFTVGSPSGLRG